MMTCTVDDCSNVAKRKGYCDRHYRQIRRNGGILKTTKFDFNVVIDRGDYYELVLTNNKLEEVGRTKIDKEDLSLAKSIGRWNLRSDGYVINKKYKILLHRLVMHAEKYDKVDHKKAGKAFRSDNRKSRLRFCSISQNGCNRGKQKNNSSGYKGVSKKKHKWKAEITYNKVYYFLGVFDTAEEAHEAYCKAADNLHKEFANHGRE